MSKFHLVGEGTLNCGIKVLNTFQLHCDEDGKTNHNTVIVSCRDVECGYQWCKRYFETVLK